MPKNVTQWANNDVKSPAKFTPVAKNAALWSGDITKNPTAYTPVAKNDTSWNPEKALQSYFYDSMFTYDSDLTDYDYLVNSNNINQRGQTAWSAT